MASSTSFNTEMSTDTSYSNAMTMDFSSSSINSETPTDPSSPTNDNPTLSCPTSKPIYKPLDFSKYNYAAFTTVQEAMEALFNPPYPDPKDELTQTIVDIHLVVIEWGNQLQKQPRDQAKCQEQTRMLRGLGSRINRDNVDRVNPLLVRWLMARGFLDIGSAIPKFS